MVTDLYAFEALPALTAPSPFIHRDKTVTDD